MANSRLVNSAKLEHIFQVSHWRFTWLISGTISFSQLVPMLPMEVRAAQSYVMDGHWMFSKGTRELVHNTKLMHEVKGESLPISMGKTVPEMMQNDAVSEKCRQGSALLID